LACLSALLQNALTVAPSGSTVALRLTSDGSGVRFCVEDDGPALKSDLRERAFSAGAQPEIKGDRAARYSRGLGLYAVSRAAQLAGVVVEVGERERGSRITIVAPLVQ
jgi:signal transduction histidine kinase